MNGVPEEIERVQRQAELIHSAHAVQQALDDLARRLNAALADRNPLILCVMTGGLVPTGWLLPRLRFPLQLDYVHATRYRGATRGRELEWHARPATPVRERVVLLVDDIFDEGLTLAHIAEDCRARGARQVFSAVLIRKQHGRNRSGMQPDFSGLTAPDRYLFGCGLDYKNYLRNLPALYATPENFSP